VLVHYLEAATCAGRLTPADNGPLRYEACLLAAQVHMSMSSFLDSRSAFMDASSRARAGRDLTRGIT
jgi:hypothetical protein